MDTMPLYTDDKYSKPSTRPEDTAARLEALFGRGHEEIARYYKILVHKSCKNRDSAVVTLIQKYYAAIGQDGMIASVLITDTVNTAVGVFYDKTLLFEPIITVRSDNKSFLTYIKAAKKKDISVVENAQLANALYALTGTFIPEKYFQDIAIILARVFIEKKNVL
jgi:type III secretion system FlhB-like substrate exporter